MEVRLTETETETEAETKVSGALLELRGIPSVLHAFVEVACTRVDVRMERCNVTSAATLRDKVPGMASTIWTACSRVAMRSVQDPVVP